MSEPYNKISNSAYNIGYNIVQHHGSISTADSTSTFGIASIPYSDTFTGFKNPGWKAAIRAGQDATTVAGGKKYSLDGSLAFSYHRDGHWYVRTNFDSVEFLHQDGNMNYQFQNPGPFDVPPASLTTEVRNRAIRKFLESAKSVRSSFEAGQDLGELKQTIEAFRHPMQSLKDLTLGYFSKLKKAKKKYRGPGLRKAVSDSYLEYRFGWRPLALDIADAYEGLRDSSRMQSTAPCYGSAFGAAEMSSSVTTDGFADNHIIRSTNTYVTYSYRIKGAIRLDLVDGRIPVMQALQLDSLNDFAVTAWDLLPYSFVVDYFVNVGDIINAITFPTSKLTYCVGTSRTGWTSKFGQTISLIPPDGGGYYWDSQTLNPANAKLTVTTFSRSPLTSIDLIPSVRFALPISSRPWENMGALISSNIRSLVPLWNDLKKGVKGQHSYTE
jgi:hypothetical protein